MGIYGDLQKLNQTEQQQRARLQHPPLDKAQSVVADRPSDKVSIPPSQPQEAQAMNSLASEKKETSTQQLATMTPRNHATVIPRYHDTTIQLIRAAVRQIGKEAATHRFTLDEKKAIAEVVFAYKKEGIKTSENEISRIGVNFLIEDYRVNGEKSILSRVLQALNG